eukprot:scaffold29632_cov50-Phaeocystis_antarctica.AAC.2
MACVFTIVGAQRRQGSLKRRISKRASFLPYISFNRWLNIPRAPRFVGRGRVLLASPTPAGVLPRRGDCRLDVASSA